MTALLSVSINLIPNSYRSHCLSWCVTSLCGSPPLPYRTSLSCISHFPAQNICTCSTHSSSRLAAKLFLKFLGYFLPWEQEGENEKQPQTHSKPPTLYFKGFTKIKVNSARKTAEHSPSLWGIYLKHLVSINNTLLKREDATFPQYSVEYASWCLVQEKDESSLPALPSYGLSPGEMQEPAQAEILPYLATHSARECPSCTPCWSWLFSCSQGRQKPRLRAPGSSEPSWSDSRSPRPGEDGGERSGRCGKHGRSKQLRGINTSKPGKKLLWAGTSRAGCRQGGAEQHQPDREQGQPHAGDPRVLSSSSSRPSGKASDPKEQFPPLHLSTE